VLVVVDFSFKLSSSLKGYVDYTPADHNNSGLSAVSGYESPRLVGLGMRLTKRGPTKYRQKEKKE